MEHGQIVLDLFVPADQDTAKAVHPTVSAFDHPASGLEADLSFERLRLFTSGSNVQRVPEGLAQLSHARRHRSRYPSTNAVASRAWAWADRWEYFPASL